MPVIPTTLPKASIDLLRRNINRHLKNGRIPITKTEDKSSLALHIFPLTQKVSLDWQADTPAKIHGYIIFIGYQGEISAAIELFRKGKRFNYAHAITGTRVDELVDALNKASDFFVNEPTPVSLSFDGHFLAKSVILSAKIGETTSYYQNKPDGFQPISQDELSADFKSLQENRQT